MARATKRLRKPPRFPKRARRDNQQDENDAARLAASFLHWSLRQHSV